MHCELPPVQIKWFQSIDESKDDDFLKKLVLKNWGGWSVYFLFSFAAGRERFFLFSFLQIPGCASMRINVNHPHRHFLFKIPYSVILSGSTK